MNEPKYQWSKFAGQGKDEQYVVREDDFETFKEARKNILDTYFSATPTVPDLPFPEREMVKPSTPTAAEVKKVFSNAAAVQEKADEGQTRECKRHPGEIATLKVSPWGARQYSHKEDSEAKGWCNMPA